MPDKKTAEPPHQEKTASSLDEKYIGLANRLLQEAIRAKAEGRSLTDAGIVESATGLCDAMRADGLSAEKTVILLKKSWQSLPEINISTKPENVELLNRIVSICIRTYYSEKDTG